jgi:hypothetical protein
MFPFQDDRDVCGKVQDTVSRDGTHNRIILIGQLVARNVLNRELIGVARVFNEPTNFLFDSVQRQLFQLGITSSSLSSEKTRVPFVRN